MRYFPVFADLKQRKVIVAGGGEEALRKVRLLRKTEALIAVVAPTLHPDLAGDPRVQWLARDFRPELLDGATLVFAADPSLNATVAAAAQARGIPVNAVDTPALSTFIVPSIVDRHPVVVAIGTEGAAPVLAQGLRARIDALLPAGLGRLAEAARGLRERVAAALPQARRRSFWQRYFFGSIARSFLAGDAAAYDSELARLLGDAAAPPRGRVTLVSAADGNPEHLTLKAQRKLYEADLIVHDAAVAAAILEVARRDAVRRVADADSPAAIVAAAARGEHVVRITAGSLVGFARSAELAAYLTAGLSIEAVPAVNAAETAVETPGIVPFPRRDSRRRAVS
jgi:uroporphyrin-III C-methyltransferase/precorrin-2 dehydrogenase/sirohydrochlorin ferrochelatase